VSISEKFLGDFLQKGAKQKEKKETKQNNNHKHKAKW
jgi:hypothetical protein